MELVDMHGTPEAPVLSLQCIYHGYSLPGHRKMIQQKLKFLISMLQGLIFIFRAVESLRKIVIVSMQHPWPPRCPAEDTPSRKSQLSCSPVSDALLSSQPITPPLGNVSLVTWGIRNFQLLAAFRCNTAPLFSADGSVLYVQGRRRTRKWSVTSLLGERAFESVPNSYTSTPKSMYYNYCPVLAGVGKKNSILQHRLQKTCGFFFLFVCFNNFLNILPMEIM